MSHDVLAELQGYYDELAEAVRYGRDEKAAAVREQIDRVKVDVEARAAAAAARAESATAAGQDVLAAGHEMEARRYRDALTDPGAEPQAAVSAAPMERAVPRKAAK
jgi:hypothetical protein